MQIHELQKTHANKKPKRIGRGGKRGTYSGRGIKGQKSRAGRHMRPQLRDEIKKLHKKRGHGIHRSSAVHSGRKRATVVDVAALNALGVDGETINPAFLRKRGAITKRQERECFVKILGNSAVEKKLSVSGCVVSLGAKKAIEAAGGTVTPAEARTRV